MGTRRRTFGVYSQLCLGKENHEIKIYDMYCEDEMFRSRMLKIFFTLT